MSSVLGPPPSPGEIPPIPDFSKPATLSKLHLPPTPASPPAPSPPSSLNAINNRIQSLISEYHTLDHEISDHSKQIAEIKASRSTPAANSEAIIKQKEDAISKMLKQMSSINSHLETEFGRLDEEFVKFSSPEVSDKPGADLSPERLQYLKALEVVSKREETVAKLLRELILNPNSNKESMEQLRKLYRDHIQPQAQKANKILIFEGIAPADLEIVRKEQRQLHEKRGFYLGDLQANTELNNQILLRLSNQDQNTLKEYLREHSNLSLREYNELLKSIQFVPTMEGAQKDAFEKCERYQWSYKQSDKVTVELTFKQVLDLCLKQGWSVMKDIKPIPKKEVGEKLPSITDVRIASGANIEWTDTSAQRNEALKKCNELYWMDGSIPVTFATVAKYYRSHLGETESSTVLSNLLQKFKSSGDISENEIRAALGIVVDISWKLVLPVARGSINLTRNIESSNQQIEHLLSEFTILNREYTDTSKKIEILTKTPSPDKEAMEKETKNLAQISAKLTAVSKDLVEEFQLLDENFDKLSTSEKEKVAKEKMGDLPDIVRSAFQWANTIGNTLEKLESSAETPKESIEGLRKLYLGRIAPLKKKVQTYVEGQRGSVGTAAAEVGRALQAGLAAMREVPRLPKSRVGSAQLVDIVGTTAVYKRMTKQAEKETILISNIADFYSPTAVMHSYTISQPKPARFGMAIVSQKDRLRGYSLADLSKKPKLKGHIRLRLSFDDERDLERYQKKAGEEALEILFIPQITKANEAVYEKCEKFKWKYTDAKGKVHILNFKQLQELCANETTSILSRVKALKPIGRGTTALPTRGEALTAINSVSWEVIYPEQLGASVSRLHNVAVKPYADMILARNIPSQWLERLWQNLTPEAEYQTFMTAEHNYLDLHSKNLGIRPKITPEYEECQSIPEFSDLKNRYLSGTLNSKTVVTFTDVDGITKTGPLENFPKLQKALEVKWEFVLFDTDLSMGESNYLYRRHHDGRVITMLPFRSVFLESLWKDKPLSRECLELMASGDKREDEMRAWIKGLDRPVYKKLSKANKDRIVDSFDGFLKRFSFIETSSLSSYRSKKAGVTIDDVAGKFADFVNRNANNEFWQMMESDVGDMALPENVSSLEKFAIKHHLNLEKLKLLNPTLRGELKPGTRIRTLDLTSKTPEADKNRMNIAKQFFPRMTPQQQEAFFERRNYRKAFISKHQELQKVIAETPEADKLQKALMEYVGGVYAPLSSSRRSALESEISRCESMEELEKLGKAIASECQPTYGNIAKVMYPLLADGFELGELIYGRPEAGKTIGLHTRPLEDQIAAGLSSGNERTQALAQRMSDAITEGEAIPNLIAYV